MLLLRWVAAALLLILAGVVGLLGVLLTATVVLLPLGIPLLMLAGRLLTWVGRLVLPAWLRHPLRRLREALRTLWRGATRRRHSVAP
ncbi:MAG TPA: hypothetical protein VHO26_12255 [Propionibacteriaceae bacterium]|nr:hypothetical protein [Propionibacteriaceae bacterium]